MRRFAPISAALGLVLLVSLPGSAQTDAARPLPYLLDVGDLRALVRYSPGALDRASHVQTRFALLAEDFTKWSGETVPLSAVLLSRTDWEALELAVPYGLPARLSNGEVALCAWGDQGTVAFWRELLGGNLPVLEGHPLHGTRDEAASLLLADLLAQGVAARALLERAGFAGYNPDVLNFAAHVVALTASTRHEPLSLGELKRVYSVATPGTAETGRWHQSLAGETPYFRAAEALLAKRGPKAPKSLLRLMRKTGVAVSPATVARKFPEVRGLLPSS